VLSKLQVALCILAGVGIVVFIAGVMTNIQVKQFGPVSGLLGLLAWGSVGLVFASCIGVVAAQVLETREPRAPKKPKKVEEEAESTAEKEAAAEDLAPVVATAEEPAVEAAASSDVGAFEAMPEGLETELDAGEGLGEALPDLDAGEGLGESLPDLDADFLDFKEEE
jgi:hypothetical protein